MAKRTCYTIAELIEILSIGREKRMDHRWLIRLLQNASVPMMGGGAKGTSPIVFRVDLERCLEHFARVLDELDEPIRGNKPQRR
jgi:hypothetical protein